ncbi:riboflavin synthase [Vulgatibacter incomptus]|uniref:Riboflavin synthase n=1 Tax=Vulgatibacter incomptus TaxID=1391653 RepID=A0A0K1PCW1_9BACT|nr:riboflavin synthase [Vulgatibacter incomptus]AKU91236.1 Riboflavin synthase eukaryotic [Vulgatibacter incomptus]
MFTGLIQEVGEVERLEPRSGGTSVAIRAPKLAAGGLDHGESIAVDGCCLTVTDQGPGWFAAEASPETLARTALGDYKRGAKVNLERALALGDRLGGHLVLGHVDGVGRIVAKHPAGAFLEVWIEAPTAMEPWLIEKGSVAVDGISLTVNALDGARFSLMLIPETQGATTLASKSVGAKVNLEGDLIGKYVARLLATRGRAGKLDEAFLKEHGFA